MTQKTGMTDYYSGHKLVLHSLLKYPELHHRDHLKNIPFPFLLRFYHMVIRRKVFQFCIFRDYLLTIRYR